MNVLHHGLRQLVTLHLLVVFAANAVGSVENLVFNGSFEQGDYDEISLDAPELIGWEIGYRPFADSWVIVEGGRPGHFGQRCLQINTAPGNERIGFTSQRIPINAQRSYIQSGWLKTTGPQVAGTGVSLGRWWFDKDGKKLSPAFTLIPRKVKTAEWTRLSQTLVPDRTPDDGVYAADEIPVNAAFMQVWVLVWSYQGTVWVDDLRLAEGQLIDVVPRDGAHDFSQLVRNDYQEALRKSAQRHRSTLKGSPVVGLPAAAETQRFFQRAEERVAAFATYEGQLGKEAFAYAMLELEALVQRHKRERESLRAIGDALRTGNSAYVVFQKHTFAKCDERTLPTATELNRELTMSGCPGEIEPASFAVHAVTELTGVSLLASDFRNGDNVIGQEALELHVVKVWPRRTDAGIVRVPELLVKNDLLPLQGVPDMRVPNTIATEIPAATTKQFWLTVRIPEEAAPGTYTGALELQARGVPSTKIPVTLQVYPFVLAETGKDHGIFYRGMLREAQRHTRHPQLMAEPVLERARFIAELSDIREHGFDFATLYSESPFRIHPEQIVDSLEAYRDAGFRKPAVIIGASQVITGRTLKNTTVHDGLRKRMLQLQQQITAKGLPEVIYYGQDEPGNEVAAAINNAIFAQVRAVKALSAVAVIHDHIRAMMPQLDICTINIDTALFHQPAHLQQVIAGDQTAYRRNWYYFQIRGTNPARARMLCGLFLWRSRFDGIMPYCYYHPVAKPMNPYNQIAERRAMCTAYPAIDQPVATLEWEAAREGIDDLRYIATLEEAIRRASAEGRPTEEATAYLRELWTAMDDAVAGRVPYTTVFTPDAFVTHRQRIARLILQLLER